MLALLVRLLLRRRVASWIDIVGQYHFRRPQQQQLRPVWPCSHLRQRQSDSSQSLRPGLGSFPTFALRVAARLPRSSTAMEVRAQARLCRPQSRTVRRQRKKPLQQQTGHHHFVVLELSLIHI